MMIVGTHELHSIAPPDHNNSKNIDGYERRPLPATSESFNEVRAEPDYRRLV